MPLRKHLQRVRLKDAEEIGFPSWPVDRTVECIFERLMTLLLEAGPAERIPFIWFWPDGHSSCAILTHDVEATTGRDFCPGLMDLDDAHQIKASFQIIPESRYRVPPSFLDLIRSRGFEINVHDLNHDGRLYDSRERFLERVERINRYGVEFKAAGFRSGALYHNLDWYGHLKFSYDMSVPSVGHLEAQRGGCCSVMPFFIDRVVELPVTVTQDYSLFHILNNYSIDPWKRQLATIMESHGLASFIVHPDYVIEARARKTYSQLLAYLADLRAEKQLWTALPGEVDRWWRARSQMQLTLRDGEWVIEGPEHHRAKVAYAVLDGGRLAYEIQTQGPHASARAEEPLKDALATRTSPACVEVTTHAEER